MQEPRNAQLTHWLRQHLPSQGWSLASASADASFRRYWRVRLPDGATRIVMDAPPSQEDVRPWLHVQSLFTAAGVHTPRVYAQDIEQGFLLLSDLGDTTYLTALRNNDQQGAHADVLYRRALHALIALQKAGRPNVLPAYDHVRLRHELQLFPNWYLTQHLQFSLTPTQQTQLQQSFADILCINLAEPCVFVHRDYHSRNLMDCEDGPGILDFQDAVYGPITYDLVSLFKDAYIAWPEEQILDWLARYWELAKKAGLPVRSDFADFFRDYEWMGVQRHLKILGIFARLYHRDGKTAYLDSIPLVEKYLRDTCARYHALTPLLRLLDAVEGRTPVVAHTF